MHEVTGIDYRKVPAEILKQDRMFIDIYRTSPDSRGRYEIVIRCNEMTKMNRFNTLMEKYKWPSKVEVEVQMDGSVELFPTFTKIDIKKSKQCGKIRALYHCEDGPARYGIYGNREDYYLDGRRLSEADWKLKMKKIQIKKLRKMS
jgi:hypothetical protein